MRSDTISEFLISYGFVVPRVVEAGSMADALLRMVEDAEKLGRLTRTEAAVVRDFIWHTDLPGAFLKHPADGGNRRQERF